MTKLTTSKKTDVKSKPQDAIHMLTADHEKVSQLFEQYEKSRANTRKKKLVSEICNELTVHAQIEEEIFYPAVKKALEDTELVPEALVEHATLKYLIAQVKDAEPDGEIFDAKIKVMSEYVKHHVKEEEKEMFAKAKASKLDMVELGEEMTLRKEELMASIN